VKPVTVRGKQFRPVSSLVIVAAATLVALTLIIAWTVLPATVSLEVGQLAKRDIEAPRTIVNRPATERLREEARKAYVKNAPNNPDNYEINQAYAYMAEEAVDAAFEAVKNARAAAGTGASATQIGRASRDLIEADNLLDLTASDMTLLAGIAPSQLEAARHIAVTLTANTMRQVRVTEANLQQVIEGIPDDLTRLGLDPEHNRAATTIVSKAIKPNLSLDLARVERAAAAEADKVQPVYVHKGQNIIRRGDVADTDQIAILEDLGLLGAGRNVMGWVGVAGMVSVGMLYVGLYSRSFTRRVNLDANILALLAIACAVVLLAAGLLANLAPSRFASQLVPTAYATMVVSALVSLEAALALNVPLSILVGMVLGGEAFAMLASLLAGAAGAYSVSGLKDRVSMTRAAAYVGGSMVVSSLLFGLVTGDGEVLSVWYVGIANGIISTVMTLGCLPFFESLFGLVSPMRLLELSNPGHPLLKRLLMEAPGTYHHSILVGNLAETAAQAVGADALLVRVGALYHDVGKLKRPFFFVENQFAQGNPHDKISPALSTLVITSHAKDGVELARQHRLPPAVIDIVRQHHGTGLVQYFYALAAAGSGGAKDTTVAEDDFRYPGPAPQSTEAAIVMLADSVEAAVRSMPDVSPWQVKSMVRKIIWGKLNDGQLDHCNLTLRDLHSIENAFLGVLSGIYHERIEYPDLPQRRPDQAEGDAANAGGDNQPTEQGIGQRGADEADLPGRDNGHEDDHAR
jgi:putative nucleotidyltransferase with HDIG domain